MDCRDESRVNHVALQWFWERFVEVDVEDAALEHQMTDRLFEGLRPVHGI